jgi:hypothetical protein
VARLVQSFLSIETPKDAKVTNNQVLGLFDTTKTTAEYMLKAFSVSEHALNTLEPLEAGLHREIAFMKLFGRVI